MNQTRPRWLSKTILLLSGISLMTDMASEMLYPILPIYLESIGISALGIGFLEGLAAALVAFSKVWFGKLSDSLQKRVPFVRIGYGISALSKPLFPLFPSITWVFITRLLDRFGKGIRTGARDALLADESTIENRGKVFGLHRAMDTFGAALGPAFALVFLFFYPKSYRELFFLAVIPGLIAVLFTFLLKEKKAIQEVVKPKVGFKFNYWKLATPAYKKAILLLLFFALFNSSDMFLILQAKAVGLSDTSTIALFICFNLLYAITAYPAGVIFDKKGEKSILSIGFLTFAAAYFIFAQSESWHMLLLGFGLYALFMAFTEGIAKAWLSKLCGKEERATAMGFYSGAMGLMLFVSNIIAGLIWTLLGAEFLFLISALGALVCTILLFFAPQKKNQ